ncbi:MAG: hydrogenase maturation protease [Rhizobiales bacterium]|nr:hydrogenase maturation protease [Hyphomicrobiales bacterium]
MLTVIGCGNLNRSDDGVGVIVARMLLEIFQGKAPKNTQIFDAGTDGMGVMFKARGSRSLIIVDAGNTGSEPGTVFEVPGHEMEGKPPDSYNLHDFRWDHALYAGRKIFKDDFPADIQVFLIEAKSLELGLELSQEAVAAAEIVTSKIAERLKNYARE